MLVLANKIDDRAGAARARAAQARPRRPAPHLQPARARHRRPPRRDRRLPRGARPPAAPSCPRTRSASPSSAARTSASRASSTRCSAASGDRLRGPRHDARLDRHRARARRPHVRPRRHRRPPPKRRHRQGIEYYSELRALEAAERADVALVLIDASQGRRPGSRRRGRGAQGGLLDPDRALQVGRDHGEDRGRARPPAPPPPPAPAVHRRLRPDRARPRAPARHVAELFDRHTARIPTPELNRALAELSERRAAAVAQRQAAERPLRHADPRPAAALPRLRQRPEPRHARLRLLGRERAARALRPRRRAGLDRLRAAARDGSSSSAPEPGGRPSPACCSTAGTRWCSPATRRSRRDAIAETGRNPRS